MDYTVSRYYCTTGFFIYLSYLPNRGVVEKNYCWFLLLPKRYVYKETEQMLTMQAQNSRLLLLSSLCNKPTTLTIIL